MPGDHKTSVQGLPTSKQTRGAHQSSRMGTPGAVTAALWVTAPAVAAQRRGQGQGHHPCSELPLTWATSCPGTPGGILHIKESQKVWAGGKLKEQVIPTPCHRQDATHY